MATLAEKRMIKPLRDAFARRTLIIVVGAGVTLNAIYPADQDMTWTGLVRSGLDFICEQRLEDRQKNGQLRRAYEALEDGQTDGLLAAASTAQDILTRHGQFPEWLDAIFGSLEDDVKTTSLLETLGEFHGKGTRFVTTNYDHLLERYCRASALGRSNVNQLFRYKTGQLNDIFHVHGSYLDPKEVVLSAVDYYRVTSDSETQRMLQGFLEGDHRLLFIGCGSGLEDPNFGALLKWAADRSADIANRHCVLLRDDDTFRFPGLQILRYGKKYDDLEPYLRRLLGDGTEPARQPSPSPLRTSVNGDIPSRPSRYTLHIRNVNTSLRPKIRDQTLFNEACSHGDCDALERCLDSENKGTYPRTPLSIAAQLGTITNVKDLLSKGAKLSAVDEGWDIFGRGVGPMLFAGARGDRDLVDLLLEHGADINKASFCGLSALHEACRTGRPRTVELLLESGADLKKRDMNGETPLHVAAFNNQGKTLEKLLARCNLHDLSELVTAGPLTVLSTIGCSPLHLAAAPKRHKESNQALEVLLQHHQRVWANRSLWGDTPRPAAVLECLSVDVRNAGGNTPLHAAVSECRMEAIRLLIRHGADPVAKNQDGITPVQIAIGQSMTGMVDILESANRLRHMYSSSKSRSGISDKSARLARTLQDQDN